MTTTAKCWRAGYIPTIYSNMSRERKTLRFEDGREAEAIIDKGNRKNLYIQIKEGEVVIKTPAFMSESEMMRFVASREEWIFRSLSSVSTSST